MCWVGSGWTELKWAGWAELGYTALRLAVLRRLGLSGHTLGLAVLHFVDSVVLCFVALRCMGRSGIELICHLCSIVWPQHRLGLLHSTAFANILAEIECCGVLLYRVW